MLASATITLADRPGQTWFAPTLSGAASDSAGCQVQPPLRRLSGAASTPPLRGSAPADALGTLTPPQVERSAAAPPRVPPAVTGGDVVRGSQKPSLRLGSSRGAAALPSNETATGAAALPSNRNEDIYSYPRMSRLPHAPRTPLTGFGLTCQASHALAPPREPQDLRRRGADVRRLLRSRSFG
jgi:hypothetical protein